MGHESVLEHAVWTFVIVGVSRAFSHQLVRHRVGFAFSQLSQQYHDENHAKFVFPEELQNRPIAAEKWLHAVQEAKTAYEDILEAIDADSAIHSDVAGKERRRAVRSAARSVLPNATETKIVVTANARALRHFLRIRGEIIGDLEMRRVSTLLLNLMMAEAPSMFGDFELSNLPDGTPIVRSRQPL
jgi:thymidylate synthase (FAD)